MLSRQGNKSKMSGEIQLLFPKHEVYIEPFFGAGGMFFNKPKAKHNFVNDLDSDVFNLFMVVTHQKEEFIRVFKTMPAHQELMKYWNKNQESDPILKAVRFIFLSNFSYMSNGSTLTLSGSNAARLILDNLDRVQDYLFEVKFGNTDAVTFIKSIAFRHKSERKRKAFIYADPPYLDTSNNYSNSFTKDDSVNLFDALEESDCKFAISEFDHPFILEQVEKRGLNLIVIGERQNLKNRRTEILITNYDLIKPQQKLF